MVTRVVAGGKRLRPLLCCAGWLAGGGGGGVEAVTRVAASLELFHTFALIHHDIMDRSDTRRGRPTAHHLLAARHPGHPAAVVNAAGLDAAQSMVACPLLDTMRTETLAGQYLDNLTTGTTGSTVDEALSICRLKTARYSVQRPLELGASLAGADPATLEACAAYGLAIGEAFQLRDDLLGVFGNSDKTGKPALDDLRQGKPTVLMAIAHQRADSDQRRRLCLLVGDPGLDEIGAADARGILVATGARAAVETMIADRYQQALGVCDEAPMLSARSDLLRRLATLATTRNS